MFITIISHCQKKARKKSFVLIDRYATRIGDNVWTTQITEEGLKELCRGLKNQSSKFTSIVIYRNKGYNSQELYVLIGNQNNYDKYDKYAIGIQKRKKTIPMFFRHASLIARSGGLAHDFGKMTQYFQNKLFKSEYISDPIRHEWISAWIIHEMMGFDKWEFKEFQNIYEDISQFIKNEKIDNFLWDGNKNIEDVIKFIILTHHKPFGPRKKDFLIKSQLPQSINIDTLMPPEKLSNNKDNFVLADKQKQIKEFNNILKQLQSKYDRLKAIEQNTDYLNMVSIIARASLILADHKISAIDESELKNKEINSNYFIANSKSYEEQITKKRKGIEKKTKEIKVKRIPKQFLAYHLKEVANQASKNVWLFDSQSNDLPVLDYYNYENLLMPGDPNSRFAWQDKAIDFLRQYQDKQTLVFNIASTGSGKTVMNAKTLMALKEGNPLRISSVLNLRSLTLQTHASYKKDLRLTDDECVCMIGDITIKKLNELQENKQDQNNREDQHDIDYDDKNIEIDINTTSLSTKIPEWLSDLGKQKKGSVKEIIGAPVLISTIDYLIAAGELHKQGHHAIALLRASTSDVIIDEIDSYDIDAFISVLKLITIHAMMGRNVVVSSATLLPEFAEVIVEAFNTGIKMRKTAFLNTKQSIIAINDLIDPQEFTYNNFKSNYNNFCQKTTEINSSPTKKFQIAKIETLDDLYNLLPNYILDLHEKNSFVSSNTDYERISVGLIRVANIKPCIQIAKEIKENFDDDDYDVRVCAYHAKEILSRRFYKEHHLDKILNRKNIDNPNKNIEDFINDNTKFTLNNKKKNLILIVVATPVEEIGRDHDFDWAIIEPSSMHSIIQTAGRVNRHRLLEVKHANLLLLQYNIKYLKGKKTNGVFIMPGFEIFDNGKGTHKSYNLFDLMNIADDNEHILNYKYIYGDNQNKRSSFSDYDAGAICKKLDIVKDILNFKNPLWASDWFHKSFPLRERKNDKTYYFTKDKNNMFNLTHINHNSSESCYNIDEILKDQENLKNTFLSPSLEDSLSFIKNLDKQIEDEKITKFNLYYGEEIKKISWAGIEVKN